MEEGELSDSSCETTEHGAPCDPPSFSTVARPSAPTPVEAFRKSQVPGLSSDSEDSDSDIEEATHAKRKCPIKEDENVPFRNPLLEKQHHASSGLEKKNIPTQEDTGINGSHNRLDSKVRKDVWGNVLAEQVITQEIGSFAVEKDLSELSYRDVEAYEIPKRQPNPVAYDDILDYSDISADILSKDNEHVEADMKTNYDEKEDKNHDDLFDIETFGTISEQKPEKPTIKERLGNKPASSDSDSEYDCRQRFRPRAQIKRQPKCDDFQKELERYKLKRKREEEKPKKNIKSRLGKPIKSSLDTIPSDLIHVTADDSKEKIVNALVHNLREPKVDLMTRVVDTLGARKATDLLAEAITIESTGGLMVKDGSRRRTPGGVFLFLIREDHHITKEDVNKIFAEEREVDKQKKRKYLQARRANLAHLKRPQDNYFKSIKSKSDTSPDTEKKETKTTTTDLDMEEGEIEGREDEDDLDLNAEIEFHFE